MARAIPDVANSKTDPRAELFWRSSITHRESIAPTTHFCFLPLIRHPTLGNSLTALDFVGFCLFNESDRYEGMENPEGPAGRELLPLPLVGSCRGPEFWNACLKKRAWHLRALERQRDKEGWGLATVLTVGG